MYMMSILCLSADDVHSGNWFTVFKVLMLNIAMQTMLFHLSYFTFNLGLVFVSDFSNIGARTPTSAERTPYLPAGRAKWFERHGNLSYFFSSRDTTLIDDWQ